MTNRDRALTADLAEVAYELITQEGIHDPNAEEIAYAYYEGKLLSNETIEAVRKRLGRIRDMLVEDYRLHIYLVSRTYYHRFKRRMPDDLEDARLCLPLGYGKSSMGLRQQTKNDLIWEAYVRQGMNSGGSKVKRGADDVVHAYEHEEITDEQAARILRDGRKVTKPEKPAIASALVRGVPQRKELPKKTKS